MIYVAACLLIALAAAEEAGRLVVRKTLHVDSNYFGQDQEITVSMDIWNIGDGYVPSQR